MKAHIPTKNRLSNAQRQAVREYRNELQSSEIQRFVKIACVALHEKFGFGHDRLADFLAGITEISTQRETDEIFWYHVDRVVREELKLPFDKEDDL